MTAFRALLVVMIVVLTTYTSLVIAEYGPSLFSVFFGDIAKLNWPGQFNLDFFFMLVLSGLWVAWRHEFSSAGLFLAVLALFGGIGFQSIYLLILSFQTKGDIEQILLGRNRASSRSEA